MTPRSDSLRHLEFEPVGCNRPVLAIGHSRAWLVGGQGYFRRSERAAVLARECLRISLNDCSGESPEPTPRTSMSVTAAFHAQRMASEGDGWRANRRERYLQKREGRG